MADNSDARRAVDDLIRAMDGVFKRYGRPARSKAWNAVQSSAGKQQIQKLIDSPGRVINNTSRLLGFKDWYYASLERERPSFFMRERK